MSVKSEKGVQDGGKRRLAKRGHLTRALRTERLVEAFLVIVKHLKTDYD